MKPITHLFIAGLLCLASQLFGQLTTTFAPTTVSGAIGATVDLQLKVTGFTNIGSVQFPIAYNNTVLQYLSTDAFTIPGMSAGNINATASQVRVSWFADFGQYPNGVTLAANTAIFTLHFKVLTNGSVPINLVAGTPGFPIEVTNGAGGNVTVNFQNGGATITGGTGGPPPIQGFHIVSNTIYIPKDSVRCMPVTVNDFDEIVSMQYAMHWDKNVLQFNSTKSYNLPDLASSNFNSTNAANGHLTMNWYDQSTVGVTRADGAKIYDVCFKGIGNVGQYSLITFDGVGVSGGAEVTAAPTGATNLWNTTTGVTDTVFIVSAPVGPPSPNAVTFTAMPMPDDTVPTGSTLCIQVKVTNFTNIVSAQFGLSWDATKLQLQPMQFPMGPASMSLSQANFNVATAGVVKFSWFDQNAAGITLPDNTVIFTLCFTVTGPTDSNFPFTLGAVPGLPIEVAKEPGGPLPPNMIVLNGIPNIHIGSVPCAATATTTLHVKCFGGSDGAATSALSPCTPQTYAWAGPNGYTATTKDITGLKAGTYMVTITAAGGTTYTATTTVNQPATITLTPNPAPVTCFGGSDGAINLIVNGGSVPYSFVWSGPTSIGNTQQPSGLKAGNYLVTVTDNYQCSAVSSPILVSGPSQITLAAEPHNVTCFGMSNGSITLTPNGGTPGYSYAWSGPGGFTANTQNISNLNVGLYTPTVTDSKGCSVVGQPVFVQGPSSAVSVGLIGATDVKCKGDANGGINLGVTGGTAPYSYTWKDQGNVGFPGVNPAVNLPAGMYNVTVYDASGCTGTLLGIPVNAPPTTLTVDVSKVDVKCFGATTGEIHLTPNGGWPGPPAPTVTWSPQTTTGMNPTGLQAGVYTATVTDAGGCSLVQPVTINGPGSDIIQSNVTVSDVTCHGDGDGHIIMGITGSNGAPWTVTWSGTGLTGMDINNLNGGFYTPTVTDAQGCSKTFAAIEVFEPDPIGILLNPTDQSGNTPGFITTSVSGGILPYSYNWAGPSITAANQHQQNPDNLQAGTYTVTVTDANGCSQITTTDVGQDNPVSAVITSVTASCDGDGCIYITVSAGAVPPISVNYGPGQTKLFLTTDIALCGLPGPANYGPIIITDFNGNSFELPSVFIDKLQPAEVNSVIEHPNQEYGDGKITLTSANGAQNSYQWDPSIYTGSALMNLDSGTYCVTITNMSSNCTKVACYTLVRKYLPFDWNAPSTTNPTCASSTNGSITINPKGANDPYTFSWTGPNGFTSTAQSLTGLAAGTYNLTLTDEGGVTKTNSFTLVSTSLLSISNVNELSLYAGNFQVSSPDNCDGSAAVVAGNGPAPLTYLWSNGETGVQADALCGGDYSVTVTDNVGCTAVWNDNLTAPPAIVLQSELVKAISCNGICDGTARIYVNEGVAPFTIHWPSGDIDQVVATGGFSQAENLCGGDYAVSVTDANNITKVQSVTVPEPPKMELDFNVQAPQKFTICNGTITATANGTGTITYAWTSNNGQSGDTNLADELCAGEEVQFIAIDANGCSTNGKTTVPYPADGCLLFSPVLTPGQIDNRNDFLIISCIETVQNKLEIYNRWGQLVYQTENYDNNSNRWEGLTSANEPLPEGAYFYVLTYVDQNGNSQQLKGYINLVR